MGDKPSLKTTEGLIKVALTTEFSKSDGINSLGVKLALIKALSILKLANWILSKIHVFKFFAIGVGKEALKMPGFSLQKC